MIFLSYILSRPTYSTSSLLFWRSFIYEEIADCILIKSGNRLVICVPRWSIVVWRSNILIKPHPPTSYSRNNIIYHIFTLGTLSVCVWLSVYCMCVTIAESTAILLVLAIKLIKETRRRVWRGRDRDGDIWKGTDRRGRVWIHLSLFKPKLRSM